MGDRRLYGEGASIVNLRLGLRERCIMCGDWPAETVRMHMLHTIALPGGLRLLVEELPHTHSVSLGCFVGVGSGHEQRAVSGISHFIEHMLFKGSEHRPTPKLISDAIE